MPTNEENNLNNIKKKERKGIWKVFQKILWLIILLVAWLIIIIIVQSIIKVIIESIFPSFNTIFQQRYSLFQNLSIIISSIVVYPLYKKRIGMGNKLFLIILFILIIILLLKTFLISPFTMDNDYLNPYLKKGNFFIVEIFNKNIKRGDIVVANSEEDKNIISIVIGLPNDKIELKNGTFFVNNEPLQDIHYDFHFWNGFNKKTDEKYLIVPSDSFLGIPTVVNQSTTNISGMFYDLSYCLFKNYDIIGKLIFPSHKVKIEPYIGEDSCNGYQPLSCPPESKYYCPEKGKPFCCSGEIIDGFCEVCSEGEAFTLDADGKNEMCCNKDYICNNRCYSRCLDSQKFICDKEFGGYCCGINQNVALDNTKKNKMCCDINYVCNGLCYSCTDVNAEFICNNKEGGFCCQPGQKLALGADDKNICCNKDYICNGLCYSICPSGQHFVCDPIKGGLCTI